jgi:hypothetical protein
MSVPEQYNELRDINFKMVLDDLPNVEYYTQDVSLPAMSLDAPRMASPYIDWQTGGSKMSFEPLNLTFIVDEDLKNVVELYKWMYKIQLTNEPEKYFKSSTLHILDGNKETTTRIYFRNMIITNVSGFQLSSKSSEATPIDTTVSFVYSYFYFDTMIEYLEEIQSPIN